MIPTTKGSGACKPLEGASMMKAIRSAVIAATGEKEADLTFELRHCAVSADGATEATVVVPVKRTGRVHTFRVASDAKGRTVSVRHEGVHIVANVGFGSPGDDKKSNDIKKWVWVGIACAIGLAVVITVAVVVAKKAKAVKERASALADAASAVLKPAAT